MDLGAYDLWRMLGDDHVRIVHDGRYLALRPYWSQGPGEWFHWADEEDEQLEIAVLDPEHGGWVGLQAADTWIRIRYQPSSTPTSSYGYCLFRDQREPTYIEVLSIEVFQSETVVIPPAPAQQLQLPQPAPHASAPRPLLQAFHVGQGMCSLIATDDLDILMDCGIGRPVKRPAYQTGALVNDLTSAIAGAGALIAVVSHIHSDHWNLLDWDATLRAQVQMIVIASGIGMLAFKSKALAGKVVAVGTTAIPLGGGLQLDLLRTAPATDNANGRGLVGHLHSGTVNALLPGDYVYKRFASDGNPGINALACLAYDALVAPHHGCAASASHVPAAKVRGRSQAFMSAGDDPVYLHPREESLSAHSERNFRVVNDHTTHHVLGHTLLG